MTKRLGKIKLEKEKAVLDQYDYGVDEVIYEKHAQYAPRIGEFFISFSNLEISLNRLIITMISDRSDEEGYRMIKYLNFRNKIELANDQYKYFINYSNSPAIKLRYARRLSAIFKKLQEISEFRNKVAHANWMSLTKKGFVRTKIRENYDGKGVEFENIKITPAILYKFQRQCETLVNDIDDFLDRVFPDILR